MDMMFWMELLILVIAIAIGARWGGLGLGAAGGIGLGVLVFGFGLKPGAPPISVLMIMTAVIACCSILQGSGGLDFLVNIASRLLRKHPKYITIIAPFLCYCFTLFCGTAYVAFCPVSGDRRSGLWRYGASRTGSVHVCDRCSGRHCRLSDECCYGRQL